MDDASAERLDPCQGTRKIVHLEIGQRERVSRAAPASVDADGRPRGARLPTPTLGTGLERKAKQAAPEAARALGVIGWELDQRGSRCHPLTLLAIPSVDRPSVAAEESPDANDYFQTRSAGWSLHGIHLRVAQQDGDVWLAANQLF
jgi:hypothetical protein